MTGRFALPLLAMRLSFNNSAGVVSAVSIDHLAEVESGDTGVGEKKVSTLRMSIF